MKYKVGDRVKAVGEKLLHHDLGEGIISETLADDVDYFPYLVIFDAMPLEQWPVLSSEIEKV